MNNVAVSHYYCYSSFPAKCILCHVILDFRGLKVILISNTSDSREIVAIGGFTKPFMYGV